MMKLLAGRNYIRRPLPLQARQHSKSVHARPREKTADSLFRSGR